MNAILSEESSIDSTANTRINQKIRMYQDRIIATILKNPELAMSPMLDVNIFTSHKPFVLAIIKLSTRGIVPDAVTISDYFEGKPIPGVVGSLSVMAFMLDLHINEPAALTSNFEHWLKLLRSAHATVEIYKMLKSGVDAIEQKEEATDVLSRIVSKSMDLLTSSAQRQHSFTSREMMRIMVDRLAEVYDAKDGDASLGIKTGIAKLDNEIQGLFPTDMIVVGARPAVGKTAFGMTIAINAARQGRKIGIISTEMSVDQIAFRAASQVGNLDSKKFRRVEFDQQEWSRVSASANTIANFSLRVCDRSVMRVSDVFMQCRAWDIDGGVDLIIIDYLTRIRPDKPGFNSSVDVGEIAVAMKNIARELKVPVVVLAQLNRGSTARADQTPRMSDLRDSGVVEQEADSILLLHHDDESDVRSIIVDKNRHGEAGSQLMVEFDKQTMTWWSQEPGVS